jgi:hypothetical protein
MWCLNEVMIRCQVKEADKMYIQLPLDFFSPLKRPSNDDNKHYRPQGKAYSCSDKLYNCRFIWVKTWSVIGGLRTKCWGKSWGKLRNEKILNLKFSLHVIRMIKPRMFRQMGHVARVGWIGNACKMLLWKFKGWDHLEDRRTREKTKLI